jgi:iron complex outermembrane receptor protein
MRLNRTRETQTGEGDGETSRHQRSDFRLSGGLGASFQLWSGAGDAVWLFADVKDAFKPAAVDFGPEAEGEILKPETARTYEAGVKGVAGAGKLDWQASAFQMDFENLLVARTIDGRPALENGGSQRFEGVEIEGKWRLREALSVEGSYAWHSARFRDFVQEFDGVPTQLAGNRLEMSPDRLAALGVFWAPERGWRAYARGGLVGERFLTKRNTAVGDAYTMVAAGLSHRFEHGEVGIDADNLTDERPPVSESELGESSYYRLPARSYRASLTWRF